jgi:hypothetical protein
MDRRDGAPRFGPRRGGRHLRKPLAEYVPLQKLDENVIVTQFPMEDLEKIGLLKMDFELVLGERTGGEVVPGPVMLAVHDAEHPDH